VCTPLALHKPELKRTTSSAELAELAPVKFMRVVDGDTLHLLVHGRDESVRLIGIDTPELHYRRGHPDYPEPYAAPASDYLRRVVEKRRLFLELDLERRDHYGRLLGYLWAQEPGGGDLIFVNAQLLRAGLAQLLTIPPNVKYVERFVLAQRKARNDRVNLWEGVVIPQPVS